MRCARKEHYRQLDLQNQVITSPIRSLELTAGLSGPRRYRPGDDCSVLLVSIRANVIREKTTTASPAARRSMVAGSGTGFTSDWNCIVSTVPSDQESWNAVCTVPFFT